MKRQLEQRLNSLKSEFESGTKVLAELDAKRANVQSTMMRIQGAIQVLEEMLAESEGNEADHHTEPEIISHPEVPSNGFADHPVEVVIPTNG